MCVLIKEAHKQQHSSETTTARIKRATAPKSEQEQTLLWLQQWGADSTQSRRFRRAGTVMTRTSSQTKKKEKWSVKLSSCDQNSQPPTCAGRFLFRLCFQVGWSYLDSENKTGGRSVIWQNNGVIVGLWSVFIDFTVSLTFAKAQLLNSQIDYKGSYNQLPGVFVVEAARLLHIKFKKSKVFVSFQHKNANSDVIVTFFFDVAT